MQQFPLILSAEAKAGAAAIKSGNNEALCASANADAQFGPGG